MKVLIVDDHELIWSGMRGVLERLTVQQRPGQSFECHAAKDVTGALSLAGEKFDLVLLDYHLPGASGVEALRILRPAFEEALVVIISGDPNPRNIRQAIEEGAAGYIPKTMPEREMLAALSLVLARGIYLPPIALLDAEPSEAGAEPRVPANALAGFMSAELSPRQREVFAQALRGKPNKIIARELGIAEGTVKVHLAMVFRALGVKNRTEAMYRVLSADASDAIERL